MDSNAVAKPAASQYELDISAQSEPKTFFKPSSLWSVWLAIVAAFAGFAVWPVSNTLTRSGSVLTLLAAWSLLAVISWRHRWLRVLVLTVPILCAALILALPKRQENVESLRQDFVAGLRRYDGVRYIWGGECITGIDCSGLVRRGMIDSLFLRGLRTCDAGLIRHAIWLWWHDCTASDLGDGQNHLTVPVLATRSINALDHSRIAPGDLAVTSGGEHVMAYLGGNLWIEADPLAHRVITVPAPSKSNAWFHGPMRIVRWSILN